MIEKLIYPGIPIIIIVIDFVLFVLMFGDYQDYKKADWAKIKVENGEEWLPLSLGRCENIRMYFEVKIANRFMAIGAVTFLMGFFIINKIYQVLALGLSIGFFVGGIIFQNLIQGMYDADRQIKGNNELNHHLNSCF